ncbi:MAG: hypothetical protein Faunusvirus8_4 [Faunusvirus sp.]|jgi:hypothetical protein|uniref:Ubiquitin-like domain-containing protein n=1 Tax=Faunusvirus sp. TaxID=2487766 RepID=A0A3G4ZWK2_9VIRU|nr:MAG: hypothetical protein Faunusvirus8_4 [Faunusvirus sp.]
MTTESSKMAAVVVKDETDQKVTTVNIQLMFSDATVKQMMVTPNDKINIIEQVVTAKNANKKVRIIYQGKLLDLAKTFADYKINEDMPLQVVVLDIKPSKKVEEKFVLSTDTKDSKDAQSPNFSSDVMKKLFNNEKFKNLVERLLKDPSILDTIELILDDGKSKSTYTAPIIKPIAGVPTAYTVQMNQLFTLGFTDTVKNLALLTKSSGNFEYALENLTNE